MEVAGVYMPPYSVAPAGVSARPPPAGVPAVSTYTTRNRIILILTPTLAPYCRKRMGTLMQ
jgi:hypothetical protein